MLSMEGKASLFAYKLRYLHTITLVPLVLLSSKPTLFDTIRQWQNHFQMIN